MQFHDLLESIWTPVAAIVAWLLTIERRMTKAEANREDIIRLYERYDSMDKKNDEKVQKLEEVFRSGLKDVNEDIKKLIGKVGEISA